MTNTALQRLTQAILTNKSGGAVAQGDVVVIDSGTASSFTTTTTVGFVNGVVGVVIEPNGIANNATGMVAFAGPIPVINLSGSASLGDLFKTHSVAKQAVRHTPGIVAGDFGIVLGTGATPPALLWGLPAGATGAGSGDVTGPGSAISGHLATFNGTTGKIIQDGGAAIVANSDISPTTTDINAAVNTRYFANVSGLTADRNFVLPTGTVGDQIELYMTTGSAAYTFIIKGAASVTINNGSAATEWSRVFIGGESVKFVAQSITNWVIIQDGRIPCKGQMTLSTDETTNTAGVATIPTWDNKVIDVGLICDTTNFRFNIRRAGYYRASGEYWPAVGIADQKWMQLDSLLNTTPLSSTTYYNGGPSSSRGNIALSPKTVLCAVGDYIIYKYSTEEANKGMESSNPELNWVQVEEVIR